MTIQTSSAPVLRSALRRAIAFTLPIVLTGCPAVLSDWKISGRSDGTDASIDAAGPDAAGGSSGTGSGGSLGSGGGSSSGGSAGSSGGVAGTGGEPNTGGGTSAGGTTGTGGATDSGGAVSTGGAKGMGGTTSTGGTAGSGGAPNDSGSCANDLSNIQTGDFHISFDVLAATTVTDGPLLEQRGSCDQYTNHVVIAEQSTRIIAEIGYGVGSVNVQSIDTVNDGIWHHVVVARVSGTLSITIDGQLDNSIPNAGSVPLGPLALLQVGRSACTTSFAGQIKSVCVERK
jgi:hypothetical protein